MDISLSDGHPRRPPRGFAALHRDVWRVVRQAPLVYLVLPAVVWFPIDMTIETLIAGMQLDEWRELRYYLKLQRLASWVFGTFIAAIQLHGLKLLARREPIRMSEVLRGGFNDWLRMVGVFFSATWRITLATLLLIVPGIYLAVRYSLAMPVAAFEEKRGSDALEASGAYVKGAGWRIFFFALGAIAIYLPAMTAPALFLPEAAGPLSAALASIPTNVLSPLMIVGLALVYTDRRDDRSAVAPVGQSGSLVPVDVGVPSSGVRGVVLATSSGVLLALVSVVFAVMPEIRLMLADTAFEAGRYEEALSRYESVARSLPEDAYVEYSLGWCLVMLDDLEGAETRLARAVALEPANPYYVLDQAAVLIELQRWEDAAAAVGRAEELEHPDIERVQFLRSSISLSSAAVKGSDSDDP